MDAREGMALAAYNAGVAINQVNVGNGTLSRIS